MAHHPWLSVVTQLLTAPPVWVSAVKTAARVGTSCSTCHPSAWLSVTDWGMSPDKGGKSPLLLPNNC